MTTVGGTLAYQNLGPEDILDAIEATGVHCDGRLLALNSYENRVYQVGQPDGSNLVAKFYRPGRWSEAAILEEHAFSQELADDEIPVVPPLLIRGQTLHQHAGFSFALFPCRGGRTPELDDLELLGQLGRLIGRIHARGRTRRFRQRPTLDIHSFGELSLKFLLDHDFVPPDLRPAYATTCEDLLTRITQCFDRAGDFAVQRLHGDLHPGNVLVNNDQLFIVDLDDARTGPTIQDVWMFLSGDQHEQGPQLAVLLEGYTRFADFDARELHLIEALRTLRMMHYAAWIARRWEDPAFKQAFPWFAERRYWDDHVLALREQAALMQEPPLVWDRD
jgi:Ser/Thr protein kinase RdoA (MazF antagonist)